MVGAVVINLLSGNLYSTDMFPSKLANEVEAETYEFGLVRHWGRRDILPTKFGPKKVKI